MSCKYSKVLLLSRQSHYRIVFPLVEYLTGFSISVLVASYIIIIFVFFEKLTVANDYPTGDNVMIIQIWEIEHKYCGYQTLQLKSFDKRS